MISKLTKSQKWNLVILIILYWGAVQFISLAFLEHHPPNVVNPFRNSDILIFVMNLGAVVSAIVFLGFQAFIYRLILQFLKVKLYPSTMKSLFYLLVGYIPFIFVIYTVFYLFGSKTLIGLAQNMWYQIGNSVVVAFLYALVAIRDGTLEKHKGLTFVGVIVLLNIALIIIKFGLNPS